MREVEPAAAYDLWAATYDEQPSNLILHLDGLAFRHLLAAIDLQGKTVVDIGCGTGRHWPEILQKKPSSLTGYDVSAKMLERLQSKFPEAKAWLLHSNALKETKDSSTDAVVSTLAIAHMADLPGVFSEWDRILRSQGDILLTDFHPAALGKGADRTFRHNGQLISIRSQIYSIDGIRRLAQELEWSEVEFMELKIDETVKHYYEEQGALSAYRRFLNTPVVYGLHLKKA